MSNDAAFPTVDPPAIEVLFSGNLAEDDHLWVVRCTIDALHQMFENPLDWVAGLSGLEGWTKEGAETTPDAVLTPDFAIVAQRSDAEDPLNLVLVQGISGSNALSIVAPRGAALLSAARDTGRLEDSFDAFWKRVASDPDNQPSGLKPYPVVVLEDLGRWYGHFEVRDPVMEPLPLAIRTATFLLAKLFDPEGFAAMLSRLDQKPTHLKGGETIGTDRIEIVASKTPPTATFYANAQVAPTGSIRVAVPQPQGDPDPTPTPPPPPPPDPFICDMQDGLYLGGSGSNDGGTTKRYGVDTAP